MKFVNRKSRCSEALFSVNCIYLRLMVKRVLDIAVMCCVSVKKKNMKKWRASDGLAT